jgi:hypothetical protein
VTYLAKIGSVIKYLLFRFVIIIIDFSLYFFHLFISLTDRPLWPVPSQIMNYMLTKYNKLGEGTEHHKAYTTTSNAEIQWNLTQQPTFGHLSPCPAWERRASTCERALLPHADKHMSVYVLELRSPSGGQDKHDILALRRVWDIAYCLLV